MPRTDASITRHFAGLPDPRVDRTRKHALGDILVVALCAVIAGADSCEEVERFGEARKEWLKHLLKPPHGIPSHDTFYRVFARLDPAEFGRCVANWMGAVCKATGLRHVAIDGKACRSAPGNTFNGCLYLVSGCSLESLAVQYRRVVGWLEAVTGTPVRTVHVVGGGSRNRLLNQLTADATGRPGGGDGPRQRAGAGPRRR